MSLLENYIIGDIPMEQSEFFFQIIGLNGSQHSLFEDHFIHMFSTYVLIKLAWLVDKNTIPSIDNTRDLR